MMTVRYAGVEQSVDLVYSARAIGMSVYRLCPDTVAPLHLQFMKCARKILLLHAT